MKRLHEDKSHRHPKAVIAVSVAGDHSPCKAASPWPHARGVEGLSLQSVLAPPQRGGEFGAGAPPRCGGGCRGAG